MQLSLLDIYRKSSITIVLSLLLTLTLTNIHTLALSSKSTRVLDLMLFMLV